jgi:hypothetical protein
VRIMEKPHVYFMQFPLAVTSWRTIVKLQIQGTNIDIILFYLHSCMFAMRSNQSHHMHV